MDLFDAGRRRPVPVRLHLPESEPPWSLVVFSVGFGGVRDDYRLLASAWAREGFATAVVQHAGSDPEALAELNRRPRAERTAALQAMVRDPDEMEHRPRDLSFVLDRLSEDARLRADRVGLAGHSFGAYTALAAGGVPVTFTDGGRELLADPRGAAVLALSPPAPGTFFREEDHARIGLPVMLVTGTMDHGPFLDSPREDRARAYELLGPGERWLAVFDRADHMAFAEKGLRYKPLMAPLQQLTSAFWHRVLRGGPPPEPVEGLAVFRGPGPAAPPRG